MAEPVLVSPAPVRAQRRSSADGVDLVDGLDGHCACGGHCPDCADSAAGGLPIGPADDAFEREADQLAERVMAGLAVGPSVLTAVPSVQRTCSQPRGIAGGAALDPAATGEIQASHGQGRGLDPGVRSLMERHFGADFSGVRVHTDDSAARLSRAVSADAFTVGVDVYFDAGKYMPYSDAGRRLLAHELTHTLQQRNAARTGLVAQRQTKSTKCTDAEVTRLNLAMHQQCNQPRRCTLQGDSCATATAKVAAGNSCVRQRTVLQQKCFSPGDPNYAEHMQMLANDSAALRNCIQVMIVKCAAELAVVAAAAKALKNAMDVVEGVGEGVEGVEALEGVSLGVEAAEGFEAADLLWGLLLAL